MNDQENPLEPTRLLWFGLIAAAIFGLGIAVLRPPEGPAVEVPTPGPSPAVSSLQCLDGKTFQSIDELMGQPGENGFPTRGRWTIAFANGGYVLDQFGVSEAGRYRCDGATVVGSSALGSHRGQHDAAAGRLAWDGQGYELPPDASTPKTTATSG